MSYSLISGNDKSVPAHLVAIARCDLPAIHLPGGTQLNAPDYVTSDEMWSMGAEVERGELPRQDLEIAQRGAAIRTVREFAASEVARVLTGQPPLSAVNQAALPAIRSDTGT